MSGPFPDLQSRVSLLGPGIAGLFIQGIESGLVFAQFSQWFFKSDRSESSLLSTIVVFVTVVGHAQSGVSFASAWSKYVRHYGTFPLPDWSDYLEVLPTLAISVPVQALIIRRCYYIVDKNLFIIIPLVLLLVASVVISLYSTVLTIRFVTGIKAKDPIPSLQATALFWPYMMSALLPSLLDLTLTGILLRYLTRTKKQVYAAHTRKRISRFANIVWQSALPPTLCAICLCVIYVRFTTSRVKRLQYWITVFHTMIGKLYVLSLLYTLNAQPLQPHEQPITLLSTLTVPAEVVYTRTLDARGGDIASGDLETVAERRKARTVDFAV